jgi:hypothetical protein
LEHAVQLLAGMRWASQPLLGLLLGLLWGCVV